MTASQSSGWPSAAVTGILLARADGGHATTADTQLVGRVGPFLTVDVFDGALCGPI